MRDPTHGYVWHPTYGDALNPAAFKAEYARDLRSMRFRAVILTAFLGYQAIDYWGELLEDLIANGRRVCIYVQAPDYWFQRRNAELPSNIGDRLVRFENNLNSLIELGAHINLLEMTH